MRRPFVIVSFGLWCAISILALSFTGRSLAQPASQPTKPQWKSADDKLTKEAIAAYEASKNHLLQLDYPMLAKTLADNRRPLLPKAKQTEPAVAETAAKLQKNAKDVERTKQVVADVDAAKPKYGAATTTDAKVRDFQVTLVKLPLLGTAELARKHELGHGPEGTTTDAQSNLAVLMVKHDGEWYWNPFGW
jgi:hypothetical protein